MMDCRRNCNWLLLGEKLSPLVTDEGGLYEIGVRGVAVSVLRKPSSSVSAQFSRIEMVV